jgi:hypothetical protein
MIKCTKKAFEKLMNQELGRGKKIDGKHPSYYFTHVNVRTYNIRYKMGTIIRKYNPAKFNELYRKFGKKCR